MRQSSSGQGEGEGEGEEEAKSDCTFWPRRTYTYTARQMVSVSRIVVTTTMAISADLGCV